MTAPFCPALHEMMLARGADYERIEGHWEETGDPENGPGGLSGWPTTDQYIDADRIYYVTEDGRFDTEKRDFEFEKFIDRMCAESDEFDTQGIECDGIRR